MTFELTAVDGSSAPLAPLREAAAAHLAVVAGDAARPVESALEPIRAWRAVFTSMGVRPTQYRCAAESLLRRLRTHGDLPAVHPVVDLCNALSVRWAVPVAVLDLDRVHGDLTVGHCAGTEDHTTFAGDVEYPDPGEVAYVDAAGHAHSRRWCWRQSASSVITPATRRVLVVAEAVHDHAETDLLELGAALADALSTSGVTCAPTLLTADRPHLDLPAEAPGRTEVRGGSR